MFSEWFSRGKWFLGSLFWLEKGWHRRGSFGEGLLGGASGTDGRSDARAIEAKNRPLLNQADEKKMRFARWVDSLIGRFGLASLDAGNTARTKFLRDGRRERPPKPGGPGPQRGPKRGVAPALLTYLPASTFGVFSTPISLACWGVELGRNRESSREPCREPTSGRFSHELQVPRRSLLVASIIHRRKTVRKTARKTDFRSGFRKLA